MAIETLVTNPAQELIVATLLGASIGLERELAQKDASFRTFSLVCVGSCLFTILSVESALITAKIGGPAAQVEPARIAAQIVSGVGFVGGGLIFRSESKTRGITTAVLIWVTAAIGMAVGFGKEDLAYIATGLSLAILITFRNFRSIIHRFSSDTSGQKVG